jgi:outer membrane protein
MTIRLTALAAGVAFAALAGAANAAPAAADGFNTNNAGHFTLTTRLTDVSSDANNAIRVPALGVNTGLKVDVSDSVVPTVGIDYYFTNNVSAELILGSSFHSIKAKGVTAIPTAVPAGTAINTKIQSTWTLPPTLTAKYHFNPNGQINPYVGGGVGAILFFGGGGKNGFKVKLPANAGLVLQAGVDVTTQGPWSVNVDVKKEFFNTKAKVNAANDPLAPVDLNSSVDLDPWIVSVGVGYKF